MRATQWRGNPGNNVLMVKHSIPLIITRYTLNQWPYLIAYLRHGQAEIDTNEVENKIREVAPVAIIQQKKVILPELAANAHSFLIK